VVEAVPTPGIGLFLGLLPSGELAVPKAFGLFLSLSPFFDLELPRRFRPLFYSPLSLPGLTSLLRASS